MPRENVLSAGNQQGRLRDKLDPWFVSGFVDGEGSFHIALYEDERMRTGWKVIPEFHVSQRVTSRCVLDRLVSFFTCGYVKANHATNPKDVTYVYVVRDRQDLLKKIIPFFRSHPLQTEKRKDFNLFVRVVKRMSQNRHLTRTGIQEIIGIAYQMNGSGRYRRRPARTIT